MLLPRRTREQKVKNSWKSSSTDQPIYTCRRLFYYLYTVQRFRLRIFLMKNCRNAYSTAVFNIIIIKAVAAAAKCKGTNKSNFLFNFSSRWKEKEFYIHSAHLIFQKIEDRRRKEGRNVLLAVGISCWLLYMAHNNNSHHYYIIKFIRHAWPFFVLFKSKRSCCCKEKKRRDLSQPLGQKVCQIWTEEGKFFNRDAFTLSVAAAVVVVSSWNVPFLVVFPLFPFDLFLASFFFLFLTCRFPRNLTHRRYL